MGSKGGAAPPPAICCMCGDHGLPQELFRCKLCLVRSQHKYCSNLYPKVESYRACNWCLKQDAAAGIVTTKDNTCLNSSQQQQWWLCSEAKQGDIPTASQQGSQETESSGGGIAGAKQGRSPTDEIGGGFAEVGEGETGV